MPSHMPFIFKSNNKIALKSVVFDEVTDRNKLAPFMAHSVFAVSHYIRNHYHASSMETETKKTFMQCKTFSLKKKIIYFSIKYPPLPTLTSGFHYFLHTNGERCY